MENTNWYLIETEAEYNKACEKYELVKNSVKGTKEHREKLLLVHLISEYENAHTQLPEVDPVELIKIRMEDFGYRATDLAQIYGDKGTISKVLNYKQPLSLNMIRRFSEFLHIPASALIKEYTII